MTQKQKEEHKNTVDKALTKLVDSLKSRKYMVNQICDFLINNGCTIIHITPMYVDYGVLDYTHTIQDREFIMPKRDTFVNVPLAVELIGENAHPEVALNELATFLTSKGIILTDISADGVSYNN